MDEDSTLPHSDGPAGGWGSMKGIARIFGESWATPAALDTLRPGRTRRAG